MIKNYLKIAIRNIVKHKGFSFINIVGLAIFIACLGLFGLASFIADRKTKEIGIRKILGASVPRIVTILNKSFVKWVLIANLIAWPASWLDRG